MFIALPASDTISLSLNLHQQDMEQQLSDLNGSSIVSSHYIEEKTIMKPTSSDDAMRMR